MGAFRQWGPGKEATRSVGQWSVNIDWRRRVLVRVRREFQRFAMDNLLVIFAAAMIGMMRVLLGLAAPSFRVG